ncbi:glycoside hydrolase family 27 protein [Compostibacter hankyongensis]
MIYRIRITVIVCFLTLLAPHTVSAQQDTAVFVRKSGWFETMLEVKRQERTLAHPWVVRKNHPDPKEVALWKFLRESFPARRAALEMSWEERDSIWNFHNQGFSFDLLGRHYVQGYVVSCHERGVQPVLRKKTFRNLKDVLVARKRYLDSREKEYVILTPAAGTAPRINGPAVYGVRPGHPVLYKVPVTGEAPVQLSVTGLPAGCTFDEASGVIRGVVNTPGDHVMVFHAVSRKGEDSLRFTLKVGDNIALTPPMGWCSWNCFGSDVTAKDIRQAVDAMVGSGLINYGWSYINIDDCWMNRPGPDDPVFKINDQIAEKYEAKEDLRRRLSRIRFDEQELVGRVRDEQGRILSNKDFPDMKALTGYIHGFGLKAGIYTSPGHVTCQNYIGAYGHEEQDARQFATWGFDFLKYDWCGYSLIAPDQSLKSLQQPYIVMHDALSGIDRDILFSICQYGRGDVWKWGASVGGNMWRTTSDVRDTWSSISEIGFGMAGKEKYAGPGHWNDPDQLVVGYVGWSKNLRPTYLSPNEQYLQVSLWSLLSAPLIISADLTRLDKFTLNLLTNREVIRVNQDVLGRQAHRVIEAGTVQVWAKPLADGSVAVGIFNLGEMPVDYQLDLKALGLEDPCTVRDLWRQKDVANRANTYSCSLNRHAVKLLKLTPLQRL